MRIRTIAIAAMLTVASITGFNQTSINVSSPATPVVATAEAASTLTIEEAAQKLAATEKKAWESKKSVTATVKVSCKSKKKIESTLETLFKATAAAEVGVEPEYAVGVGMASRPSNAEFANYYKLYGPYCNGKATLKGKVLTVKLTVKGGNKTFRSRYEENYYTGLNVAELKERVEGLSEKDKAWMIADWVTERMGYLGTKTDPKYWTDKKLYEDKAVGMCGGLAKVYQRYACLLGLDTAYVRSEQDNHAWNAVRIDGEVYHLGMQDIDSYTNSYEAMCINPENRFAPIYEGKSWDANYTIGEYCLLTIDEWYLTANRSNDFAAPADWDYFWKF